MIDIRKLAALDMTLHGTRFIIAEFAVGIVLPLIFGFFSLRAGLSGTVQVPRQIVLGLWLIGVAVNYIPLFLYAVDLARKGTVKEEGQPELAHVKRYSIQQAILFIPLIVAVLAIVQEASRRIR
jgi:hypothetical protein